MFTQSHDFRINLYVVFDALSVDVTYYRNFVNSIPQHIRECLPDCIFKDYPPLVFTFHDDIDTIVDSVFSHCKYFINHMHSLINQQPRQL